jgi:uncharacterized caspase-like protein
MRGQAFKIALAAAFLLIAVSVSRAENRIALIIGNSNYMSAPALTAPAEDAKMFAELLSAANFQGFSSIDGTQKDMRRIVRDFSAALEAKGPDTVALLYYTGYAVQVDGENFLIPVDAKIERETDVAVEAVRFVDILNAMTASPTRARILILDTAHGNPFAQFDQTGKGLALIDAPPNALVALSAAPGTEGVQRPFTATLITAAKTPGLSIEDALKLVRVATFEASGGNQISWEVSTLTEVFSLFPNGGLAAAPDHGLKSAEYWQKEILSRAPIDAFRFIVGQNAAAGYEELLRAFPTLGYGPQIRAYLDRQQQMVRWQEAVKANSIAGFETFLASYPQSDLVPMARRLLNRARANAAAAPAAAVPVAPTAVTPQPATATDTSPKKEGEQEAKRRKSRAASDDDDDRPRRKRQVRQRASGGEAVQHPSGPPISLGPVGIGIGGVGIGIGR